MISALYRSRDGTLYKDFNAIQLSEAIQDEQGLLWLDMVNEPKEVCIPILRDDFGFHPLAIDDALEESHVPKVDDWGRYLYLVLHAVDFDSEKEEPLSTHELDLFLGENYLVTYRIQSMPGLERVWESCQRDERLMQKSAANLLYRIADEMVANTMPVVDEIDETVDQIEDILFDRPEPQLLERIFTLKRSLLHLRRIISPQREVLNKLARGDFRIIAEDDKVFFRDVYDHLVRLYDIAEGLRDLAGGALETYLSVVSNRMNEVMKILAVITTLFMPISFLSGFFGMNFFQPVTPLSAWTERLTFFVVVAVMVIVPVGMYLWMRSRRWM
ncbi:MAG: magnesium and cobalt transport protein CorA [Chloroflexi bacterium RBG_16_48_8]|nr:MAG: magnesium and cobalt transport protein CorA [Chloroflexi bacterium RBG_16_48_8]